MTFTDRNLAQELQIKCQQMQQFRAVLSPTVRDMLAQCEWSLVPSAGQDKLPLMIVRLPSRICLSDPLLQDLAEQMEAYMGPVDFALFSGETSEPLRVLSKTLLDQRWHWRGS